MIWIGFWRKMKVLNVFDDENPILCNLTCILCFCMFSSDFAPNELAIVKHSFSANFMFLRMLWCNRMMAAFGVCGNLISFINSTPSTSQRQISRRNLSVAAVDFVKRHDAVAPCVVTKVSRNILALREFAEIWLVSQTSGTSRREIHRRNLSIAAVDFTQKRHFPRLPNRLDNGRAKTNTGWVG